MESVLRGLIVYLFLLIVFRISGKRTLSQTTTFDLVLLLIISETTQQAMVNSDHSITNGFLLIATLVGASILLGVLKQKFPRLDLLLEGQPVLIVNNGQLIREVSDKAHIDQEDILNAARLLHGLERMDQIKYAILERDGNISIVPAK